jgi:hypothetical protein
MIDETKQKKRSSKLEKLENSRVDKSDQALDFYF